MSQFLNADLLDIAEAKLHAVGIGKFFDVDPDLDIQDDYIRIYYTPEKARIASNRFNTMMSSKPGPIRYDLSNAITPYALRQYGLPIGVALLVAFLIGRST